MSMPNIRRQAFLIFATTGFFLFKLPVTVVTVVTCLDFSGNFSGVTGRLPVTPEKFPEKSRHVTTVTTVTGNLNRKKPVVAKIRNACRRIFGIDIEKRREIAGLPSVADHLKSMDSKATPLADALL